MQDFHAALDYWCAAGTNIMAADSGTVLKAEWHPSYGYYILIDNGAGMATLYAHCSSILTSVGASVNKGDVIGLVGMTGSATGNHLHLEVRINGERVDPLGYVSPG